MKGPTPRERALAWDLVREIGSRRTMADGQITEMIACAFCRYRLEMQQDGRPPPDEPKT